ncbi:MAG: LysR substrate-binding domain-containing protein [Eubacteriales bacterium]|nr:LysR substrate-binding domain-containing protein [Eubacteriales bacterium]
MLDMILLLGVAGSFALGLFAVLRFGAAADRGAAEQAGGQGETLRLAVADPTLIQSLTPVLERFSKDHPAVEVRLTTAPDRVLLKRLEDGAADVVFLSPAGPLAGEIDLRQMYLKSCPLELMSGLTLDGPEPGVRKQDALWLRQPPGRWTAAFIRNYLA